MDSSEVTFEIAAADRLEISDDELSGLLTEVYVAGEFTAPDEATVLFQSAAVRKRGLLIGARESHQLKLAGVVILATPDSPARQLAKGNEAEFHLLGVRPEYRRNGLGRMLAESAIDEAIRSGYTKIILWTQQSMNAAQRLYESAGFIRIGNMKRNSREYKVYERTLCI